jgi:hypothetical protein
MRYAPPPPPRRHRPETTTGQLRRLVHTEESRHRAEERPFEPEAPREHYARPHHFAVNSNPLAAYEDHLPGTRRFMVTVQDAAGNRALASPSAFGFMSTEEAGAWIRSNLPEGTRLEVHGYVKGSESDPRMWPSEHAPNARFKAAAVDEHAATELVMFIENTSDLSPDGPHGQGRSVLLNALRKWRKGTYDSVMAVKLFEYLAESGAKRYAREFDHASRWAEMFNPATRREAARQLEDTFRKSVESGQYDDVDTRIGR